jgi:predicted CXXCH cytochrome family protein
MMQNLMKLVFIFMLFSEFSVSGQNGPEPSACLKCHAALIEQKVPHPAAVDDCTGCHMTNGNAHPLKNMKGFTLSDAVPALCYLCHAENTKANIHPPVKSGECLTCHSPHGSANKALLINAPQSALCADCHDMAMTQRPVKHKPVAEGNCAGCHDPHQSDLTKLLKKEKPALCMDCHTAVSMEAAKKNVHPPFADDCSNCHETHSANVQKLLTQKMPDLCYNCHDMKSTLEKAKVVHKVVFEGKACVNCHSPHASDQEKYLVKTQKDLCLGCHSKIIKTEGRTIASIGDYMKKGNVIHGVIESDGCIVCHNPHSSDRQNLLNGAFPVGQYTTATVENFELCFTCHDSQLLTAKTSKTASNFRNGDQNLHYLHINGEKGRNCNVCHNIHGAPFEHLISDKVKFGKWDMPIQYKTEENGGSCNTGCHAEKKYLR